MEALAQEFAATVKRTLNNKKDFQTITHLGMFMEDLGLGTNIVKEGVFAMRYIHHLILNIQNLSVESVVLGKRKT